MPSTTMTTKEIRKAAKEMILAGSTRQEAFEAMQQRSDRTPEKIEPLVRNTPTLEARRKYRTAWLVLFVALSISAFFQITLFLKEGLSGERAGWIKLAVALLINGIFIYGVSTYRGETFRLVALLTGLGFIRNLTRSDVEFGPMFFVELAWVCLIVCLAMYLDDRLVSSARAMKEPYVNAQGQERLRNRLVFGEK